MQFTIKTSKREEIIDITEQVKQIVEKQADQNSKACLVYVPHATCGIIVNENYDLGVREDIMDFLRQIIPPGKWKHDKIDNNGDSHVKAALIGPSQIIPISEGKLQLGKWQNIALAEFDGSRERTVIVKIV